MLRYSSTDLGGFFSRNRVFLTAVKNETGSKSVSCSKNRSGCCASILYWANWVWGKSMPSQLIANNDCRPIPWVVPGLSLQIKGAQPLNYWFMMDKVIGYVWNAFRRDAWLGGQRMWQPARLFQRSICKSFFTKAIQQWPRSHRIGSVFKRLVAEECLLYQQALLHNSKGATNEAT